MLKHWQECVGYTLSRNAFVDLYLEILEILFILKSLDLDLDVFTRFQAIIISSENINTRLPGNQECLCRTT